MQAAAGGQAQGVCVVPPPAMITFHNHWQSKGKTLWKLPPVLFPESTR